MRAQQNKSAPVVLALLALVALPCRADPLPAPQVEYWADTVTRSGGLTVKEKVYYSPGKLRKELEVPHGTQIEITRLDKQVAWLLMSEERLYLERGLRPEGEGLPPATTVERTPVGEEAVNQIPAVKYKVIAKQPDGGMLSGYVWVTREGITVKMDLGTEGAPDQRVIMEVTRLKVGPQAPSLFEIPSGYHKLPLGGVMPGPPTP
jgi:hypothetical protein